MLKSGIVAQNSFTLWQLLTGNGHT